jgi:hypothetical protein
LVPNGGELKVKVIVPVPEGDPVPVLAMIVPAALVDPVSTEQLGNVPPPLVKVQVGAAPAVLMLPTVICCPVARFPALSDVKPTSGTAAVPSAVLGNKTGPPAFVAAPADPYHVAMTFCETPFLFPIVT